MELSHYLKSSEYIDSEHPAIIALKDELVSENNSEQEKIVKLYLHVRDNWRYNPYKLDLRESEMKASAVLNRNEAYCIEKAVLYAALLRSAGIPSKVGFANVKNHIATEKLEAVLKTNVLVFHGYTVVHYNNQWKVATPAFNNSLCEMLNVNVLDFDGTKDSMLQQFSKSGDVYMEYIHDYGYFNDIPRELMLHELKKHYPHFETAQLPGSGEIVFRI